MEKEFKMDIVKENVLTVCFGFNRLIIDIDQDNNPNIMKW